MLASGYIGLSIVMITAISFGIYLSLKRNSKDFKLINKRFLNFIISLFAWFLYLFLLERSGILLDFGMPPKFLVLIFIPFTILTLLFVQKYKESSILQAVPKHWPIYLQSFRIFVEMLLLFTYQAGHIPESATFEGYNFDILMGITAPFIAYFVYRKNRINITIARIWNTLGIIMVLIVAFIIATSLYFPQLWNSNSPLVANDFIRFPFLLIPAFLAPLAIFMHVFSLLQLRNKSEASFI